MGKIVKISGPLVVASGMKNCKMFDVVRVSNQNLIGEIIELRGDSASIQVYEDTSMLGPGEPVVSTDMPLSAELGPGLLGSVIDGIGRPLNVLIEKHGSFIGRGAKVDSINRTKKWDFIATKKIGDSIVAGDMLGIVQETKAIEHRVLVPNGVSGTITSIKSGSYSVEDIVATVEMLSKNNKKVDIKMLSHWPVRNSRPYKEKLTPSEPLITGQRVIDTLFPIAKGGTAAVPGPFGSGKTVVQHQIAKWADADIVVYIGCGERGNEITDAIGEFSHLVDPKTGGSLMERVVLIANTSDMPVAAREASIYTGITIAEYYRDMGYSVAIMADSTSRWAEALREMSGRLEEMPGDEGYPAYLASRLAEFYERAGKVVLNGSEKKLGHLSIIGAVSPPGGDMSEPVSQATLRVVKVFWGLSAALAYKRHFPAIDWLTSYSLYSAELESWYNTNTHSQFANHKNEAVKILSHEAALQEIVRLVGMDALTNNQRIVIETAKSLREDFLHQNAFLASDSYTPLKKQYTLLDLILEFHTHALLAANRGADIDKILSVPVREKIGRAKYISHENENEFSSILAQIRSQLQNIAAKEII